MIVFGCGGHSKVIFSVLNEDVSLFIDNSDKEKFLGRSVERYDENNDYPDKIIIAIGNNKVRKRIAGELKHSLGIAIANSAIVDKNSVVGEGSQIVHGAIIQSHTTLGNHTIVNTGASVDHDCTIGDYCHIAPQVTLCGSVEVGEGTIVGAGSTVIPGIKIGKWCQIGAGSVITKNIPDYSIAVGNPARVIKTINE